MTTILKILVLMAPAAVPEEPDEETQRAVVKVFASVSPPNLLRPWEFTTPQDNTGSGLYLGKGRILTNAHVVAHAQEIYIQPHKSSDRLNASIEWLAPDADMAVLKLEDPKEMEGISPIPWAEGLPPLKSKITLMGYPTGGDALSLTEGIVSRIEFASYAHGTSALRIQVDAAINPGNSGGPGVIEGRIVGLVFRVLQEAENIGYLIPYEVIRHFLDDCTADGKYDGFPRLDIECDSLENPFLRDFLKLDRKDSGIVVRRHDRSEIRDRLKPWDVVTACDGVPIDNLGMVQIEGGLRVQYGTLVSRKPPGASVRLTILRQGRREEVEIPTITRRNLLVQRMTGDRPTYFIYGGLVFVPLTRELFGAVNDRYLTLLAIDGRLAMQSLKKVRRRPDEELVACVGVLPHRITKGYDIAPLSIVSQVNEIPVANLQELIRLVKESRGKDAVVFHFEDDHEERVVLNPAAAEKAMPEILRNNNIPSPCSEDLRELWP